MKITQSKLLQALNIAYKAVASSTIIPATECFQITLKGSNLTIAATNMKFYIRTSIEVTEAEHVCVLIHAYKLVNLLKELPDQVIEFSFTKDRVLIKYAGGKADLPTENSIDFPTMTEPKGQTLIVNSDIFIDGLNKVIPSREKDRPDMPALECVNIVFEPGKITFNAGSSGGLAHLNYEVEHSVSANLLIPEYCFSAFDLPKDIPVSFIIGDKSIGIYIEETAIIMGLFDGKFPDVTAKFTKDEPITCTVNRGQLLAAINRVKSFTPSTTKMLKLDFGPLLKITAQDHNFEHSAEEEISIDYMGEPLTIGTNADNFYNAVKRMDEFTIHLSGPKQPITLRCDNGLVMVMPVHLD